MPGLFLAIALGAVVVYGVRQLAGPKSQVKDRS